MILDIRTIAVLAILASLALSGCQGTGSEPRGPSAYLRFNGDVLEDNGTFRMEGVAFIGTTSSPVLNFCNVTVNLHDANGTIFERCDLGPILEHNVSIVSDQIPEAVNLSSPDFAGTNEQHLTTYFCRPSAGGHYEGWEAVLGEEALLGECRNIDAGSR